MGGIAGMGIAGVYPSLSQLCYANRSLRGLHCSNAIASKRNDVVIFLTRLERAHGNEAETRALIRKSCKMSKKFSLSLFDRFLQQNHCSFAIIMYEVIRKAKWYKFNPKLHAQTIALLAKCGRSSAAQSLLAEADKSLTRRDRIQFYRNLMESYAQHELKEKVLITYEVLRNIPQRLAPLIAYRQLIRAFASMNVATEAEQVLRKMENAGHKTSFSDYKIVLYCYGKCKNFDEMERIFCLLMEKGYRADTVTMNMMLSSYGSVKDYRSIQMCLARMRQNGVEVSVMTLNALAKACPTLSYFASLQRHQQMPLSRKHLIDSMNMRDAGEEIHLVEQLFGLKLVSRCVDWSIQNWSIDLHGMVPSAAYIVLLIWLQELKRRLSPAPSAKLPPEICIVCGLGKHSLKKGDSPLKKMASRMLQKMGSPFRVDRYNKGQFVGRGKSVKLWLQNYDME